MIYSRKQIDKAGVALLNGSPFERKDALDKIEAWRESHIPVLEKLNEQLVSLFSSNGIRYHLSSMRIKRMVSIEDKLRYNADKGMKLGGLQDIGGLRFVFNTIDELYDVVSILKGFVPKDFSVSERNEKYNYIEHPKPTGYRSVHFVYKHISDDEKYNGISIELQVRTKLQHVWAMAVETASLITRTSLKADLGDNTEWREFFKLVSAIFAKKEGTPLHEDFAQYSQKELCEKFFYYSEKKLPDQIAALRVAVHHQKEAEGKGFCVLTVDFESRLVHFHTFAPEDEGTATKLFNDIERTINKNEAALMVAMDKVQELQETYPSYFLDTQNFILALNEFETHCAVYK